MSSPSSYSVPSPSPPPSASSEAGDHLWQVWGDKGLFTFCPWPCQRVSLWAWWRSGRRQCRSGACCHTALVGRGSAALTEEKNSWLSNTICWTVSRLSNSICRTVSRLSNAIRRTVSKLSNTICRTVSILSNSFCRTVSRLYKSLVCGVNSVSRLNNSHSTGQSAELTTHTPQGCQQN